MRNLGFLFIAMGLYQGKRGAVASVPEEMMYLGGGI